MEDLGSRLMRKRCFQEDVCLSTRRKSFTLVWRTITLTATSIRLKTTGAYLSPKEFKDTLLDEDTVVSIQVTTMSMHLVTSGSIRPDIRNHHELLLMDPPPQEEFMDKRGLCTVLVESAVRNFRLMVREVLQRCWSIARWYRKLFMKDPEVQGELWDGVRCLLTSVLPLTSTTRSCRCR